MKHSIKIKILCSLLSVLLVMQIMPWSVFATENVFSHSIARNIELEEENVSIVCEMSEERDRFSKTYLLADGCYYTVTSPVPIHQMENGKWEEVIDNNIIPYDMNSAIELVENIAESVDTSSNGNARIIVNDNNPSPVIGRFIDTSGVLQSTWGLWLKLTGLETATETKMMVTTSAKLIVSCQKMQEGILKAYTVSSDWDEDVNYTLNTDVSDNQVALQKENKIEDYHKITSTKNYEFDITDICSKWERGIQKNNGVLLSFNGTAGRARIGGYTFARKYRIISELDEGFSYHSVDMGKAGTVYINDYTNTVLLKRDEIGLSGETMPITISRYFDFGRKYALSNPAGMAGRFNFNSSLYKISDLNYAWDMISGNTVYFSPTNEKNGDLYKWISVEDDSIILWVNNTLSYDDLFNENFIIYDGNKYSFNKNGKLILIENIESNDKITITYNEVDEDYMESIIDASGRIYKFDKKTVAGFSVYTDLSVYKNNSEVIQVGGEDFEIEYTYTPHTDNQQVLLKEVKYPDNSFVKYEYNGNNLVKIIDTDGSVLELDYFMSASGSITNILSGYEKYYVIDGEKYIVESLDIENSNTYRRVFSDLSGETLTLQYNKKLDLTGKSDSKGNAYYITYDSKDKVEHYVIPEDATNIVKNGDFESGELYWVPQNENSGMITSTGGNSALKLNFKMQDVEYFEQLIELTDVDYTGMMTLGFKVQGLSLTPKENSFVGVEVYAYDEYFTPLNHDGDYANDEYIYYSIGIDNTTSDVQYIMGAFDVCEEIYYLSVKLVTRNQINNVVFDEIVLYPSNLIISPQKDNNQLCACELECNYGNGCLCNCENSEVCNCISCKSYIKDVFINNNSTNKLEYVEHQNSDGSKSMNSFSYYDVNGNYLTKEIDKSGVVTEYNHDIYTGLLNSKTNGNNGTVTYGYNSIGLLTEVTQIITSITASDSSGAIEMKNTYSYDNEKIKTITHNGFTYELSYDELGNCTKVSVGQSKEDPNKTLLANYEYSYNFDSYSNYINKITYANGHTITYSYENDFVKWISFDGGETKAYEYEYDIDGNVETIVDNTSGLTTQYNYTVTDDDGVLTIYEIYIYETANPNVVKYSKKIVDGTTHDTFLNGVFSESEITNNYNEQTGVTINSSVVDYYNGEFVIANATDYFGRRVNTPTSTGITLNSVDTMSSSGVVIEKNLQGNIVAKKETYYYYEDNDNTANPNVSRYKDVLSEINNGSVLSTDYIEYEYEYDACGNITHINRYEIDPTTNEEIVYNYNYTYNEANQLVREDNSYIDKTIIYEYDSGGNLSNKKVYSYTENVLPTPTESIDFSYDSLWKDKLASYNGYNITYDDLGNPTSYEDNELEWNGRQLVSFKNDIQKYDYTYDSEGNCTSKSIYSLIKDNNGNETESFSSKYDFVWEDGKLIYQYKNGTDFTVKYLYDQNDEPYGFVTKGEGILDGVNVFYYVKNMQGDIERIVRASTGDTFVRYKYDAWGNTEIVLSSNNIELALAGLIVAANNMLAYRGYFFDASANLYLLKSRYYNPEWGRFLNADDFRNMTLSPKDIISANVFAYCFNNPVMFTDATGEWPRQYPVPRWTSKGFSIDVIGDFLRKNYCIDYSKAVIKEKGRYGFYKTMDDQRIASEIYAHAMIYYSSSAIKNSKLYKNKTVKSLVDSLRGKANPIDVNYDEKFYRILGFNLIWSLT